MKKSPIKPVRSFRQEEARFACRRYKREDDRCNRIRSPCCGNKQTIPALSLASEQAGTRSEDQQSVGDRKLLPEYRGNKIRTVAQTREINHRGVNEPITALLSACLGMGPI